MASPILINCPACGFQSDTGATFCQACGMRLAPAAVLPPPAAAPAPAVRYGGFWIRFVAFIIDAILVEAVIIPFAVVLGVALGIAGHTVNMPIVGVRLVGSIVGMAFGLLASWIYEAWMESSSRQATVGKMIMQLRVTDEHGRRISFARATGRHFGKYISGFTLMIGYIIAGFTARKQALHDMIAATLVVRG